jgi:hypothetical protein
MKRSFLAALLAAGSACLPAQDLIGMNAAGDVRGVDSHTGGDGGPDTRLSLTGVDAMARRGGTLFIARHSGNTFSLHRLDAQTLVTTVLANNTGRNITGLAFVSGHFLPTLIGVATTANGCHLLRIDENTGAITDLGALGFAGVTALAFHQNVLYAWDTTAGLLTVSLANGSATDVNANVAAQFPVQFLTSMSDGRLLAGHNELYRVDPARGRLALIGSDTWSDLRGVEEHFGLPRFIGTGCQATTGPTRMVFGGRVVPNTPLLLRSAGHLASAPGILCVGGGAETFNGNPLPLRVDPFVGTVDCFLNLSPDVTAFFVCSSVGLLSTTVTIPGSFSGSSFFAQHVALEGANVPGGISFTDGIELRVAF